MPRTGEILLKKQIRTDEKREHKIPAYLSFDVRDKLFMFDAK